MESILEKGLQILAGALPTPPVLLLIGIVPRDLEPGRAVFKLAVDTRRHNPMGSSLPASPETNALPEEQTASPTAYTYLALRSFFA
jgi:hypothetical protein